jgi:hypothetical protein
VNDTAAPIPTDSLPRLPRGVRLVHNEAQGGWVLLAPERVFNDVPAKPRSKPSSTILPKASTRRVNASSPM